MPPTVWKGCGNPAACASGNRELHGYQGGQQNRGVLVMDMSDARKRMGTDVDGFLGQDILREFASVRIDYKSQVLGLEQ